jgi:hypothetical protein
MKRVREDRREREKRKGYRNIQLELLVQREKHAHSK